MNSLTFFIKLCIIIDAKIKQHREKSASIKISTQRLLSCRGIPLTNQATDPVNRFDKFLYVIVIDIFIRLKGVAVIPVSLIFRKIYMYILIVKTS